ncbi:MAG: dTDP-4-dehydrorhamnose 3,5-epimerase [Bacteroidales bacterium]|jgi:dTDP-4-dehydrorhamnose 3,5-epimerase|nr:dTDP-4-dehydrorhamnose 3,5-epimerase [Bacteroidales bacterium]
MKLIHTPIEGLFVLEPRVFPDERGYFFESYNLKTLEQLGIHDTFVQDNQSLSHEGVLRGLHFQNSPYQQAKLVRVIRGAVWDVAVDLRRNSPTLGQYYAVKLTGDNHLQFFLPQGFAHGFVTLEDHTIFAYKCSQFYHKESEITIRYDDSTLQIPWQTPIRVVNDKDRNAMSFQEYLQNPHLLPA